MFQFSLFLLIILVLSNSKKMSWPTNSQCILNNHSIVDVNAVCHYLTLLLKLGAAIWGFTLLTVGVLFTREVPTHF